MGNRAFSIRLFLLLLGVSALPASADATAPGPDPERLNIAVTVFDPGIPADPSVHRDLDIFPRIRTIEAVFLPFVLRRTLAATAEWGAVRVVPQADAAAEVQIAGEILKSNGDTLTLAIKATDASGRVWIDQSYSGSVLDDYAADPAMSTEPSHQRLYDTIAADLLAARDGLESTELERIAEISLLRYGMQVAPAAFADYLSTSPDGGVTIRRLPAKADPMLRRIALVRSTEYVITDEVDAKFRELHAEIAKVYDVWRAYRRKVLEYAAEDERRARDTASGAEAGSYTALRNAYDNYKYHRITEQEQDKWAVAFNNEVGPRIESMETRIAELRAWVDDKYAEWRRILEGLHEVETALPD